MITTMQHSARIHETCTTPCVQYELPNSHDQHSPPRTRVVDHRTDDNTTLPSPYLATLLVTKFRKLLKPIKELEGRPRRGGTPLLRIDLNLE